MGTEPAINEERVSAWMSAPSTISDSGEAVKGLRRLAPPTPNERGLDLWT